MTRPVSGRGRTVVGPSGEDPRPDTPSSVPGRQRPNRTAATIHAQARGGDLQAKAAHDPSLSGETDLRPGTIPPIPTSTSICTGPTCKREIRWAVTEQGRRMPLDYEPDPAGNVVIITVGGKHRAHILTGHELPAQQQAWMPHHKTCPDSAHYKRLQHAARPRCAWCRTPMDGWLTKQGLRGHVLCLTDAEHAAWFRRWLTGRSAA